MCKYRTCKHFEDGFCSWGKTYGMKPFLCCHDMDKCDDYCYDILTRDVRKHCPHGMMLNPDREIVKNILKRDTCPCVAITERGKCSGGLFVRL